ANSVLNHDYQGAASAFTNSGTYTKSGSAGSTTFESGNGGIAFYNSGTVDIQTGTLQINAGGENTTGVFQATTPAVINFNNSYTFDAGTSLAGTGPKNLAGGTATLTGTVNVQNLNLVGGTLAGTQTIIGDLTWTAGNLNSGGTTTVEKNSTLT